MANGNGKRNGVLAIVAGTVITIGSVFAAVHAWLIRPALYAQNVSVTASAALAKAIEGERERAGMKLDIGIIGSRITEMNARQERMDGKIDRLLLRTTRGEP